MPKSEIAYVKIERIRVTRTQEGVMTGLPKEMGTHEWHMRLEVNGQVQWWDRHGIKTGGEYTVGRIFPSVPLNGGKLKIKISGWEQDTFGDTELRNRTLTLTPEQDCPNGATSAWVTSVSSSSYGTFTAEEGGGIEGDFDFRVTILPVGKRLDDSRSSYAVLVRDKRNGGQAYHVAGWDGFTSQIDTLRKQGLRLSRIASAEARPGQPSFSDQVERTFLGVFEDGRTDMPFWLLDEGGFRGRQAELARQGIRATDIFAYHENGTTMVGGTFDRGSPTELVVLPRAAFEAEWAKRAQGQGLIALDSFAARGERWFAGLFEQGASGPAALWVGADERDFRRQDNEFRDGGLRLIDFCTYNQGGTQIFNGVWSKGDRQTWLVLEPDWPHLTSRIDFNWSMGREIVAIDWWSSGSSD